MVKAWQDSGIAQTPLKIGGITTVFKAGLPKPETPKQKEKSPPHKTQNQLAA
jgi:hypothetical protein